MYFDVSPGFTDVKLDIKTTTTNNRWQISVTQIDCTSSSSLQAPSGCLQYYTGSTGTIKSFNYAQPTATPTENRQLSNQDYKVCIAAQSNACSVTYKKSSKAPNDYSFSMTEDSIAFDPPGPGFVGASCTTDYLTIPGAVITDSWSVLDPPGSEGDTFCGLNFPESVKSTSTQPFQLHVKTNSKETTTDWFNAGFSLDYSLSASC
ncbi:uncharacterized protein LOC108675069 [Hyalella azteca]|uniref:Uncharacterized protein LOC108675069 n=1 Tax=Hyalella azteca TaxID=294128 RepID=A0A8B7NXV8_HYAAZ|nr:uncharacterized protein LOC108675069 [Hyalella azteca]